MSDEDEVRRDLERGRKWERAYVTAGAVLSVALALAFAVFCGIREWMIWR